MEVDIGRNKWGKKLGRVEADAIEVTEMKVE